jgi:hypothetical protein
MTKKLIHIHKERIIQQLSRFYSNQQIADDLKNTFNIDIHRSNIDNYRRVYKKEIQKVRDTWLTKLADEPLSHKRIRLQALQDLYNKAAVLYHTTNNIATKVQLIARMESILNSCRIELENNKLNVFGTIQRNYDDSNLIQNAKKIIELIGTDDVE